MKKCSSCKLEKAFDNFTKDKTRLDGLCNRCKECVAITTKKQYNKKRESILSYQKTYYLENSDKVTARSKAYYLENKDKVIARVAESSSNNKDSRSQYLKEYAIKNRERLRAYKNSYKKNRMVDDINFKIVEKLRSRIRVAIVNQRGKKAFKTVELVGCSVQELRERLESKFMDGMSWSNYGQWHIDHIKPCASFDLTTPEQQQKCFHYSNLQPLWSEDNLSKGSRYENKIYRITR